LLDAARRGDLRARDRLVVSQLGLVRSVASRYGGLGLEYDDLVQEGSLGLLDAIERYDASRGVPFERFARFRVRRAILDALTTEGRAIRLPKHVVERRRLLERTEVRLLAGSGRTPTAEQLAEASSLPLRVVLELRRPAVVAVPLEGPSRTGVSPLEKLTDVSAPDPEHEALSREQVEATRHALSTLSPRRRDVISRRFGLVGEEVPIADLARELHLSERRTRTIEKDALRELAGALAPAA
jgi:RNA polymerase sigma factor (sigma-70 family)